MSRTATKRPRAAVFDLQQVKAYARGRWPSIIERLAGLNADVLDGSPHPCPKCGGKDRFRCVDVEEGALFCNQCFNKQNGDGLSALQWLTGEKFADVLSNVAKFLGVESSNGGYTAAPSKKDVDPARDLQFLPWNDSLIGMWCIWKQPIKPEAIRRIGGKLALYREKYTVIAIPVWGEGLDANNKKPVGWSLYNITGGTLPKYTRLADGTFKTEDVKVKLTFGSQQGIIADLSKLQSAKTIWKLEGPSDLLAFLSMDYIPETVTALTNANGAGEKASPWMLKHFEGRSSFVLHDADQPGERGAIGHKDDKGKFRPGWCQLIASAASECKKVTLPYAIEDSHGKDLRDWCQEAPRAYQDILGLLQSDPIAPASTQEVSEANGQEVIEDDTDPNRLARVNLERYATIANSATLRYWRQEWYTWKPSRGCYRRIDEKELKAKLHQSIKDEFNRIWRAEYAEYTAWKKSPQYRPDEDKGPPKAKQVTCHLITNVMAALASIVMIPSSVDPMTWLDKDGSIGRQKRNYMAMKNGILDLDRLLEDRDEDQLQDVLLDHSPEWFSMTRLPYEFDPEAKCPIWMAFLEKNLEGDQDRIDILQEWAGYTLLPDTSMQKFLFLEGEGSNGKSVYLAGLSAMLGEDNCSHIPLERFGERFERTETLGKLVNICADVGEIDKMAEGLLKSFTSGDVMFFDRKGISGLSAKPTARLIIAGNNRPHFSDKSSGVWRRMLIVPWLREIQDEEKVYGMDDPRWWEATGELPGIFLWALAGLHRLKKRREFSKSEISQKNLQEYRDESNPARVFFREFLEASDTSAVQCSLVYELYQRWTDRHGRNPLSSESFGRELKRYFKSSERKKIGNRENRPWHYVGICFSVDEIEGEKTNPGLF